MLERILDSRKLRLICEKNINETIKRVSLLRVGESEEIANLVLFLGSEASSYINGQVISIDGGLNEGF